MKRVVVKNPCPHKLIERDVDIVDVAVLDRALKGESHKSISEALGINEKTVRNKLDKLENSEFISRNRQQIPLVDTVALWEFTFLTYVKLSLAAAVPPIETPSPLAPVTPTPPPPGWQGAIDTLSRMTKPLYEKLVRCAFIVTGTSYDLALVVSAQSKDEYAEFCSLLQKTGYIEKIWGHMVVEWAGYTWDPLAVPDPEEVRLSLENLSQLSARALRRKA